MLHYYQREFSKWQWLYKGWSNISVQLFTAHFSNCRLTINWKKYYWLNLKCISLNIQFNYETWCWVLKNKWIWKSKDKLTYRIKKKKHSCRNSQIIVYKKDLFIKTSKHIMFVLQNIHKKWARLYCNLKMKYNKNIPTTR